MGVDYKSEKNRAKISIKIVCKGRTPTLQNYANLLSW